METLDMREPCELCGQPMRRVGYWRDISVHYCESCNRSILTDRQDRQTFRCEVKAIWPASKLA